MEEKISPLAAGILQGLNEAAADAQGFEVEGLKKTTIYCEQEILSTEKISTKFINTIGKNLQVTS